MTARNFYFSEGRFTGAPDYTGVPVVGLTIVRRLAHSEREHRYRAICKCGSERVIGQGHLKIVIARGEYMGCPQCRMTKLRPVGASTPRCCSRCHVVGHSSRSCNLRPVPKRAVQRICWDCAGLSHRRPPRGCPRCGGKYAAEAPVTVEDVMRQAVTNRRELI